MEWKVIEKSTNPGGLARTFTDEHGFSWDIGAHVIFSHYAYFTSLLDIAIPAEGWNFKKREAWIWMRDNFIPYPLQQNLYRLPKDEVVNCINGLIDVEKNKANFPKPNTFRQWLLQSFGSGLCETFMFPYNFKVWACSADKMNVEWMGERVATVDVSKVVANTILEKEDVGWGPNSNFRYPKQGGTGAIWFGLFEKLPAQNFTFQKSAMKIDVDKKEITYNDGTKESYDALLSTMPLNLLCNMVQIGDIEVESLRIKSERFRYSSTHIVGIGLSGSVPHSLVDKTWLYFPEDNCPFYRVSVFSNFADDVVPEPGRQWSLMCEIAESIDKPVDQNTIIQKTEQGLRNTRLISDEAVILSRFHMRLEHGYPTPFCGRDELCAEISDELEKLGIYSRGRFGTWKYEISNQDHSVMQGVEVVDHIVFGVEELTFRHPNVVNQKKDTTGRRPLRNVK